ncbi:MAG TPA: DoxX family protein [Dermatophilaceae bacterium]|jgi:putative oxidoreductase|nr:DoxX family protein [Actinomycetales bacterium]HMT31663.1 DoxX family protein [Dermatophilaceae bacterium]HMT90311.1 DoxX family protein [Dermatophilaceae bacterium]
MIRTLARPMLASIFLVSGLETIKRPGARVRAATPLLDRVIPVLGLPDDKELLVRANGAAMLAGGAMLATGRMPRVAAGILAASLVPTTLSVHSFWEAPEAERPAQKIQFLKNLSMLGGLLLATVDTEGKPGLAWRAGKLRESAAARVEAARDRA